MTNIESRLRKLVAEHLGADEIEISDHTAFQDDLGADSMDRVELSMLIEDEFHIIVTDEHRRIYDRCRKRMGKESDA